MSNSENRTMAIVLDELNKSVDKYNLSVDSEERVKLNSDHKDLVQEYNELSLLNEYSKAMNEEKPIIAIAKAYYYATVSVKDAAHKEIIDGKTVSKITRSVAVGVKKFNMIKFIEWTAECNKCVAADQMYKSKIENARKTIANEWKKFFAAKGDSHSMSIGKTKKALQTMFDALVFIAAPSGKNAIVADNSVAKWVLGFANTRKDSKIDGNIVITGEVLPKNVWNTLLMDALHKVFTEKDFEIIFESEDDNKPETNKKSDDKKSEDKKSEDGKKPEEPAGEAAK